MDHRLERRRIRALGILDEADDWSSVHDVCGLLYPQEPTSQRSLGKTSYALRSLFESGHAERKNIGNTHRTVDGIRTRVPSRVLFRINEAGRQRLQELT
jgi:hypothetical protein